MIGAGNGDGGATAGGAAALAAAGGATSAGASIEGALAGGEAAAGALGCVVREAGAGRRSSCERGGAPGLLHAIAADVRTKQAARTGPVKEGLYGEGSGTSGWYVRSNGRHKPR